MGDLQQSIESEPIRYRMRYGAIVIEPQTETIVPIEGGGFGKIVNPDALTLHRDPNFPNEYNISMPFDLSNPEHRRAVDRIDQFIADNPKAARMAWLHRVDTEKVNAPGGIDRWYELPIAQALAIVDGTGLDLKNAVRYELDNPDGPRTELIAGIEDLARIKNLQQVEESDEVPTL